MQWEWTEEELKKKAVLAACDIWQRIVEIMNARLEGKHNFRVVLERLDYKEDRYAHFHTKRGFAHFSTVVRLGVVGVGWLGEVPLIFDSTQGIKFDASIEWYERRLMWLDVSNLRVVTKWGETVLKQDFAQRLVDGGEQGIPIGSLSEQHLFPDVINILLRVIVAFHSLEVQRLYTFFIWCVDSVLTKFASLHHSLWKVTTAPTDVYAYFHFVRVPPRPSEVIIYPMLRSSPIVETMRANFEDIKLTVEFLSATGASLNITDFAAKASLLLSINDLENCEGTVQLDISFKVRVKYVDYSLSVVPALVMKFNSPEDLDPFALKHGISQSFANLIQELLNQAAIVPLWD